MPDSQIFDFVARQLEQVTALDTTVARGALRKAVKKAGLDCANIEVQEMDVVIHKMLGEMLKRVGSGYVDRTCETLARRLDGFYGGGTTAESTRSPPGM